MRKKIMLACCLTMLAGGMNAEPSSATIISDPAASFPITANVLDTAVGADGKMFFVLTEKGEVNVYSPEGKLISTIQVDGNPDLISASPTENMLYLTNSKKQITQSLTIDVTSQIDITDSPYMGVANAPVVIALFSDFQ